MADSEAPSAAIAAEDEVRRVDAAKILPKNSRRLCTVGFSGELAKLKAHETLIIESNSSDLIIIFFFVAIID